MLTIQDVARVAHEVNRHYCMGIGDWSQNEWSEAPDWQKESAIAGVTMHFETPGLGPEASHVAWMEKKITEGWVWGTKKDPEKKTHPCICLYDDLPLLQRVKDSIFIGVVEALRPYVEILPAAQAVPSTQGATAVTQDEATGS